MESKWTKTEARWMVGIAKNIAKESLAKSSGYDHDYLTVSTCNLIEWVGRAFLGEFKPAVYNSWKDCAFLLRQKWRDLFASKEGKFIKERQKEIFKANENNAFFNALVMALDICEEQEPCYGMADLNF